MSEALPPLRTTWAESDRFVTRTFVKPAQAFMAQEAAGGVVMLAAAVVALVWANSPWQGGYDALWHTELSLHLGDDLVHLDLDLREWVSDGLMAIFFLVVGLEIKRELVVGELRDRRAAALPAIAAVGGMVVPAAIFLLFNAGSAGSDGWGIPMATDIAFAAGVVSLLGTRVPTAAKLFLLTLAIVDDLGAILVIAIFYSDGIDFAWLALAIGCVVAAVALSRSAVRSLVPYVALGALCWYALHESGVHATLAGVAFGLVCPARSFFDPRHVPVHARAMADEIETSYRDGELHQEEFELDEGRLHGLRRLASESMSPLHRIEHTLGRWVSFLIVPVFALANAGVELTSEAIGDAPSDKVVLGVFFGLVVGKTVGVFGATWLAVKSGLGRMPTATTWRQMLGLGMCAGIGFTVALFVTGLAFTDPELTDQAKVGILAASTVAGLAGYSFLRAVSPPRDVGAGAGVAQHGGEPVGHDR